MKKFNHNIFKLSFFSRNDMKLKSLGLLVLITIFSSCNQGTITKTNTTISSTFDLQTKSNVVITESDLDKIYYKNLKVDSILLPKNIRYTDLKQNSVLTTTNLEETNKLDINEKILIAPSVQYNTGVSDINLSYKISDPTIISIEQNFPQVSLVGLKSGKATLEIYSNYDPKIKKSLFFEVSNNIKPKEEITSNSKKIFVDHKVDGEQLGEGFTNYEYFFLDKPEYMWNSGNTVSCSTSKNIAYNKVNNKKWLYDYPQYIDNDFYSNLHYGDKTIIIPPFSSIDWNLEGNRGIFVDLLKNDVHIVDTKTNKVKILVFQNRKISNVIWINDHSFTFTEENNEGYVVKIFDINTLSEKFVFSVDNKVVILNIYYSPKLAQLLLFYYNYPTTSNLPNYQKTYNIKSINLYDNNTKKISSISESQQIFFNKNNDFFYLLDETKHDKSTYELYSIDIENLEKNKINTEFIAPEKIFKYGMSFSPDGENVVFNKNEYLMIADKYLTNSHQVTEGNRTIEVFCN